MEIYRLLRHVQNSIIRPPGLSQADCIRFIDALNREIWLPYYYFRHWEVRNCALVMSVKSEQHWEIPKLTLTYFLELKGL